MVVRTAGNVGYLHYVAESSYGTIPTGVLSWGMDITSFTQTANFNTEEYWIPASRSYNSTTRGPYDIGYTAKGYSRVSTTSATFLNFFALYGMGATNGTTAETIPDFTTQMNEVVSTNNYYSFFPGCKIDKLTISTEGPGMPYVFEIDVLAQYVEKETSKDVTGIQTVTVGANPTAPTGAVLRWNAVSQINLAAGGLANWYPKNWKLTIDNHLERQYGHKTGGDAAIYPVTVALNEGIRDITFECELWHEAETYTDAKIANSAVTAITLTIDGAVLTLNNGYFVADDYPELKHDLMTEPIKIKFKSISIA